MSVVTKESDKEKSELVLVNKEGAILTLVLNRPERRNALTPALAVRLAQLMREVDEDPEVRVVILRGAGRVAFSSGYDITDPQAGFESRIRRKAETSVEEALERVQGCRWPTVGMIYGYCIGGGFDLASACDLRVLADDAKIAMPAARMGVVYHPLGLCRWLKLLGPAATKELVFTGRQWTAQKALRTGWANEVVPAGELEKFTYELAADICANAPLSISGTKRMISMLSKAAVVGAADLATFKSLHEQFSNSLDHAEALRAFAEKRKPKFVGR